MKLITFKATKSGITIHIPSKLLAHVAHNAPEPIHVFDREEFTQKVAFELEHNLGGAESGLSGFQQLLDEACSEVAQQGDCADYLIAIN